MKTKKLTFAQFRTGYQNSIIKAFQGEYPDMKKQDFKFDWNKRTFELVGKWMYDPYREQMVAAVREQMKHVVIPE